MPPRNHATSNESELKQISSEVEMQKHIRKNPETQEVHGMNVNCHLEQGTDTSP